MFLLAKKKIAASFNTLIDSLFFFRDIQPICLPPFDYMPPDQAAIKPFVYMDIPEGDIDCFQLNSKETYPLENQS